MAQFVSKHNGLRLLRRNAIRRYTEFGAQDTEPEACVEFIHGAGNVEITETSVTPAAAYPRSELIVLPDGPDGTDQTLLTWMRAHKENGVLFHEMVGVVPDPLDELRTLTKLVAAQDVQAIEELAVLEEETYNRPAVFEAIRDALTGISEVAPDKTKHLQETV